MFSQSTIQYSTCCISIVSLAPELPFSIFYNKRPTVKLFLHSKSYKISFIFSFYHYCITLTSLCWKSMYTHIVHCGLVSLNHWYRNGMYIHAISTCVYRDGSTDAQLSRIYLLVQPIYPVSPFSWLTQSRRARHVRTCHAQCEYTLFILFTHRWLNLY